MRHLVMFHGTSSSVIGDIIENGFLPSPERKVSEAMMSDADGHTQSLTGTYVATRACTALGYARHAAEHLGGYPVIVSIRVPLSSLIPDEDEILYDLIDPLMGALGYDEGNVVEDDAGVDVHPRLNPICIGSARKTLENMNLDIPESSLDPASYHLLDMLLPVLGESWNGDFKLLHPDHDEDDCGWSSPKMIRLLCATPEGRYHYRRHMDLLTLSLAGADPDSYPAGYESCKGRLLSVSMEGPGPVVIAAGNKDDWTSIHDGRHILDGSEEVDVDAGDVFEIGKVSMRMTG